MGRRRSNLSEIVFKSCWRNQNQSAYTSRKDFEGVRYAPRQKQRFAGVDDVLLGAPEDSQLTFEYEEQFIFGLVNMQGRLKARFSRKFNQCILPVCVVTIGMEGHARAHIPDGFWKLNLLIREELCGAH